MKLFGTDGIRGKAGEAPLDEETVTRVGAALVRGRESARAHDARCWWVATPASPATGSSGRWPAGCVGEGADVTSAGVLPTPAVAYLTRTGRFDAGIVISASHNPFEDNGIKVFSANGEKLSELVERRVEAIVADRVVEVGGLQTVSYAHDDMSRPLPRSCLRRILGDRRAAGRFAHRRSTAPTAPPPVIAPGFFRSLGFRRRRAGRGARRPQYQPGLRIHSPRAVAAAGGGNRCADGRGVRR